MAYSSESLKSKLESYGVKSEELKIKSKSELNEFIEMLNNSGKDNKVLWDETVNRYYKSIQKIKGILEHKNIKPSVSEGMINNLNGFMDMCKKPEFHIAFVGAIKAGKSTLINALLGKDLASTSVTPETASLTKFKASKGRNFIKLSFYNSDEWNLLWNSVQKSRAEVFLQEYAQLGADNEKNNWLNKESMTMEFDNLDDLKSEIKKWTSSKHATHYFVKEVEVGLSDFNLPEGIVFVDTPGLDDPVKYRSDITRMYIDRANAVFVCVKSDALTGQELRTIYSVFANSRYNPEKVYVIGTQLDALNRPADNWKEQREEWLKHLSKADCYGTLQLANKNLIGVASYLYNLCINFNNLSEDDIYFELEPISRKFRIKDIEGSLTELIQYSQIESLKSILNNDIISKYKALLINDIKSMYQMNKEDIQLLFNKIKENQLEILELTNADINKIQEQKEKGKNLLAESKKEKEEIEKFLKQIRIMTTNRAESLYNEIKKIGGGVSV